MSRRRPQARRPARGAGVSGSRPPRHPRTVNVPVPQPVPVQAARPPGAGMGLSTASAGPGPASPRVTRPVSSRCPWWTFQPPPRSLQAAGSWAIGLSRGLGDAAWRRAQAAGSPGPFPVRHIFLIKANAVTMQKEHELLNFLEDPAEGFNLMD